VPAIDREFDYTVGPDTPIGVGDIVRIDLHGRRVGGWVTALGVEPPADVALRPLAKVSGRGPAPETFALAAWAAWRWAGRRATFLNTASPDRVVAAVPRGPGRRAVPVTAVTDPVIAEAFRSGRSVVRLPPATEPYEVALAAAGLGDALILTPSLDRARRLAVRLRRAGLTVSVPPRDWAQAAAGGTVVGARAAAWAPVGDLAAVVVLDEHDESFQEERAPTWHARDVAIERARRAGAPCVLVSPTPTLEAQAWGRLLTPSRRIEREGWPVVDVIDRRADDPTRAGSLYTSKLVDRLRAGGRAVCVLNRTGRARLLACASCGELARCERCDAAVGQVDGDRLVCARCGAERPVVCLHCHRTRLKNLRVGVSRAREELEALVQEPVGEVTASTAGEETPSTRVVVGTEAVLHHVDAADTVAFLDLDQELLAPRYRAAEQALALIARGARILGGRSGGGRLLLQTRVPRHPVVQAALLADPSRVADDERVRRRELEYPPFAAMAVVSGAAADAFMEEFGTPLGIELLGPRDDRWLLKAPDHRTLCDALAATPRPPGRLRVEVDPLRT
jgi:primosomal protein N' (replication factor Y)